VNATLKPGIYYDLKLGLINSEAGMNRLERKVFRKKQRSLTSKKPGSNKKK